MATPEEGKANFARVVKLWLRENGWPQKITDDWARDPGVKAPNGPWASQICAALKAEFHPRIEFFLALGRFNQVVADKELRNITDRKTKARLVDAKPLTDDSGKVYGAAEFFALMSGLSQRLKNTKRLSRSQSRTSWSKHLKQWINPKRTKQSQSCSKPCANPAKPDQHAQSHCRTPVDCHCTMPMA